MSADGGGSSTNDAANKSSGRPWGELRDSGLLWLINATVFHPRGYALAVHRNDAGDTTGWSLLGDGAESWTFRDPDDPPEGYVPIDELFRRAKELMP